MAAPEDHPLNNHKRQNGRHRMQQTSNICAQCARSYAGIFFSESFFEGSWQSFTLFMPVPHARLPCFWAMYHPSIGSRCWLTSGTECMPVLNATSGASTTANCYCGFSRLWTQPECVAIVSEVFGCNESVPRLLCFLFH